MQNAIRKNQNLFLQEVSDQTGARAMELGEKAYRALHIGFVALAIIAGVDKFSNVISNWGQYLAPTIPEWLGLSTASFMFGVGTFEVLLGMGLALKPRLFADIFSAYLLLIIGNFLLSGQFLDLALFNFALASGACALARLSSARKKGAFRARKKPSVSAAPVRIAA